MIQKLRALFDALVRLVPGRSQSAWIAVAARLERAALLEKLATTEDGLLDREAEERPGCVRLPGGMTVTVLRRDRSSIVPEEIAADFGVRISRARAQSKQMAAQSLVPGDIVELKAGEIVPVDVRLLSCSDFQLDQSALTGSPIPVRKHAGIGEGKTLSDLPNVALAGTKVSTGKALAVVIMGGPVRPRRQAVHSESASPSSYGFLVTQR